MILNERCQVTGLPEVFSGAGLGTRIPGSEDFELLVWILPAGTFPLVPQSSLRSPQKDEECRQNGTLNGLGFYI